VADGIPKNLKWTICGIVNMLERCIDLDRKDLEIEVE